MGKYGKTPTAIVELESEYTYRALNQADEKNYQTEGIIAKRPMGSNRKIYDAITDINAHMMYGNRQESCWISTTSNIMTAAANYGLAYNGSSSKRSKVAIIKDHNHSQVMFSNQALVHFDKLNLKSLEARNVSRTFANTKLGEIERLVYDFSLKNHARELCRSGFILTKEGNVSRNDRVVNYGISNQEILVLNKIPVSSIANALTSLEVDLYYACRDGYNSENVALRLFRDLLTQSVDEKSIHKSLAGQKQDLFYDLYIANQSLADVAYSCWSEYQNCDILAVYDYFRELKKATIKDIIADLYGHTIEGEVQLIENYVRQATIGNSPQNITLPAKYHQHDIFIKPLHYGGSALEKLSFSVDLAYRLDDALSPYDSENVRWLGRDAGEYSRYEVDDKTALTVASVAHILKHRL